MTLEELRADLDELLDDALPSLAGEREPLQAERLACLIALPVGALEGDHEVVAGALEGRGGPEAADVLAAMARLHGEPLRSAAAEAAGRLGHDGGAPALELGRVVRLEGEEASLLAAELHADGGTFALTVLSDADGLGGGLGPPAEAAEVAAALDELEGAEPLHPSVAGAALRTVLEDAHRLGLPADEGLTLDGPLVVHAFGLPPDAWPDLPLMLEQDEDAEVVPEPARPVPPRPPRDAARKKAKRRNQKAARRKNR